MWRCDYCGHSQFIESRKCADCGGPRPESPRFDYDWATVSSNLEVDPVYRYTLAGQTEMVDNEIREIQSEIGAAFLPMLVKAANALELVMEGRHD